MSITFTDIAERYLKERVVSAIYEHNVRRIASRVKTVDDRLEVQDKLIRDLRDCNADLDRRINEREGES